MGQPPPVIEMKLNQVKHKYDYVIAGLCLCVIVVSTLTYFLTSYAPAPQAPDYVSGVRDSGDFDRLATDWSAVAYQLNDHSGLVDLLVAPATENLTTLPFPVTGVAGVRSVSDADLVEPYLSQFDADGTQAILSIQPQDADVAALIDLLLARYGQHKCLAGINVDLYWKNTGTPQHVSNQERDQWLGIIAGRSPGLKLFLSGFEDYTFFPGDAPDLVVLYCGSGSGEDLLLARYADLARHFANVGIYTGYANSKPPIASDEKVLASVPKTKYIIHVDNRFSSKKTVIFEIDDVQASWLESTSKALIDLHLSKGVPVTCGVVPYGLDTLAASDPLPAYLKALDTNRRDVVEIAQHGYSHNETDVYEGKDLDHQRTLIAAGLRVLNNIGVKPDTFIPPYGRVDALTEAAAQSMGFKYLFSLGKKMGTTDLLVLSTWTPLTLTVNNRTVLKSTPRLMDDINNSRGDVVNVMYHIQDFGSSSGASISDFARLLDELKSNPNYEFMTIRQYGESLAGKGLSR